jgi:hypothetical protein
MLNLIVQPNGTLKGERQMPKFAMGVTLTPAERAMVRPTTTRNGSFVREHTFTVSLPGGITCHVDYRRTGPASHCFQFHAPINQSLWSGVVLDGSISAIEKEGVSCGFSAFLMAQEKEQKEMRRKTRPKGSTSATALGDLTASTSRECGGKYAVCVRFGGGALLRIGEVFERPEEAVRDLHQANEKYHLIAANEPVVGICNCAERRWQTPQFLALDPPPSLKDES